MINWFMSPSIFCRLCYSKQIWLYMSVHWILDCSQACFRSDGTNIFQGRPHFVLNFILKDLFNRPTIIGPIKKKLIRLHSMNYFHLCWVDFIAKRSFNRIIYLLVSLTCSAVNLRLTVNHPAFWDRWLDTGETKVRVVLDDFLQITYFWWW